MAEKTIDPQLTAYYEQLKHPMPDFLVGVDITSISDRANQRFNERLWQHVKTLNETGSRPDIHEFRQQAADIRKRIDQELYESDDPERLSTQEIVHRVLDAQIAFSPVNLGTQSRSDDLSRKLLDDQPQEDSSAKQANEDIPVVLFVTMAIPFRGLSKVEIKWMNECFVNYRPDMDHTGYSLVISSPIEVDSVQKVDRWLPRRVKDQLLSVLKAHSESQGLKVVLPWSYQLKSFFGHVF